MSLRTWPKDDVRVGLRSWYRPGAMSRGVARVVLGVALAALIVFVVGGRGDPGAPRSTPTAAAGPTAAAEGEVRRGDAGEARGRAGRRGRAGAEARERMRAEIVASLAARRAEAALRGAAAVAEEAGEAARRGRRGGAPAEEETPPVPGNLVDRSGDHEYLLKVMNEELMPLVDECYGLAREKKPELAGLLVLDVALLGDAAIGGVVESVAPGASNEVVDEALLECVRESILSTTLPPPPEGGSDALSLSVPLSPAGDE